MIDWKNINTAHGRALEIAAQISALADELAAQKSILEVVGTGKYQTDHGTFQVSENNVYDDKQILDRLSPGQFMRCSDRKLSKAKVKVNYPDVYAAAKQRRGWKVSI